MDRLDLRQIIESQRDELRVEHIAPRSYALAADDCCLLVGLRRSGKSALLADHVKHLVSAGVSWSQDFSDIVDASDKPSDQKTYYFFDEIQHIEGWGRFSRHLAEEGQCCMHRIQHCHDTNAGNGGTAWRTLRNHQGDAL